MDVLICDCVRLKPADIQPDIFSYLLNLMYTGKLATQLIDPARLEQGVKFLHAYPLIQEASLASHAAQAHSEVSLPLSSSLYGIQISDQQATLTNRLSASTHLSSPFDLEGSGLLDGKCVTTNKATSLMRPLSKHRQALSETEVEASASTSQFVREGCETETSAGEASSCSLSANTILHVKPSIMRRSSSLRKHYTCHVCGGRFTQRGALREHLLLHTQAMLPLVLESVSAASPMPTGGAATPEVEEVLRGSEAAAATPIIVDAASDSEQHPETAMPVPTTTTAVSLCSAQPQADTPPPSDIADIDNLEGAADMEREVKRRKYECSTCGRKFIQKSHWREHMYIHTGKPYRCSACGKSFCRANQAARHVCMNLGSEPAYTMVDRQSMELCDVDDSSQMEALFLSSSGRPYKCNVCEMTFSSPNEVIKHLCFNQGVLSGTAAGEIGVSGLNSDSLAKDEGSDSSNGGPFITPIKTEEVFVE
ncbi:zinc finger and BTB domain-containing protein 2-like isoform X2 [Sinocyclocheilus grahami]|uniref:zinc finger and BTB domain-containing protein 2-like isoform X2 n=1 Tax=Sinocyclocheilus grahami TaxID=75366 RepID=UPI0007AD0A0E|nr:PREDICTED: zinc finger and BTB domain-containing protein 2-like isoform X2 [Sinocyclocheilus grahami]